MTPRDKDDYWGDVLYEVWRSGGDVDRVDYDRVEDARYDGYDEYEAAASEMRHQQPEPNYDPELDPTQWDGYEEDYEQ